MLKRLRGRVKTKIQDGKGNAITMNKLDDIYAFKDQCFYSIILYIKTMSAQVRPFSPGNFNMLLLKEYHNIYRDKKDIYEKETDKIITNT